MKAYQISIYQLINYLYIELLNIQISTVCHITNIQVRVYSDINSTAGMTHILGTPGHIKRVEVSYRGPHTFL